jgi:transcriptional regulator of aromatic amino acid metabolism
MSRSINLPDAELCDLYTTGQSTTALAQRYGCSPTTIAKHLRDAGVTLRCSRFLPIPIDEAALRRMYLEERLPIVMLATHFGVSSSTIRNKRRRYGIPPRLRRSTALPLSR